MSGEGGGWLNQDLRAWVSLPKDQGASSPWLWCLRCCGLCIERYRACMIPHSCLGIPPL